MTERDSRHLITSLIAARSLCIDCIARQCDLEREQAESAIRDVGRAVEIDMKAGRCSSCPKQGIVYRLA